MKFEYKFVKVVVLLPLIQLLSANALFLSNIVLIYQIRPMFIVIHDGNSYF